MRFLLTSCLSLFAAIVLAQSASPMAMASVPVPKRAEASAVQHRIVPQFPGGHTAFTDFVATELDYPELAQDYAIEGTVVIKVAVDAEGGSEIVSVERGLFAPLDEAALAAAEKLPRLLPAVEEGHPVACTLLIPFHFSLK